jgi:hypothetical protein
MKVYQQKSAPPAKPPPKQIFTVREPRLCAQMGMNENEVRRRRNHFLHQGQHWDYVDKRVMYSEIGAQVLLGTRDAVLDLPGQGNEKKNAAVTDTAKPRKPIALLLEKNPTRLKLAFQGKLIVWAAPPRNPKVVVCYIPGGDPQDPMALVSLRVRDNSNFLRGMQIPDTKPPGNKVKVTPVADRDDVFDLQGPIPRWRGKW